MRLSKHIQHVILWVMLAVVAVAYAGKALHTHTDSYYDSLRTTRSAASNGMSDDCPICHFNLLLFLSDNFVAFSFFTTLLTVIFTVQPIVCQRGAIRLLSLRAPPVML